METGTPANPPPPQKTPADMAGAVALIQASARASVEVQVKELETFSGRGDKLIIPVAFLPDGDGALEAVPLGQAMLDGARAARELRNLSAAGPERREGTAEHQALSSFIEHANRFKAEHSAIWANPAQRVFLSVLDYHPRGPDAAPRWGKHRGVYPCPLSEAWTAWGGTAGLALGQDLFAKLLDERDRELTTGTFSGGQLDGKTAPPPSDLVTLAGQLETYSRSTAKREREPTGRTKLTFTEEQGTSVAVPRAFLINIRVFEDGPPQTLEVRLAVRLSEKGQALFHLRIHGAAELLRESFADVCARVGAETSLSVFIGVPE